MMINVNSSVYQKTKKVENSNETVELTSFDTEQALLGALLIQSYRFDAVAAVLREDDFSFEQNRLVYGAMQRLNVQRIGIDIITIQSELERNQLLERAGGQSYLLALMHITPGTYDIISYARIVSDKAKARRLVETCSNITKLVYHPGGRSINDILDTAEGDIFKLNENGGIEAGPISVSDIAANLISELADNSSVDGSNPNKKKVTGLSTGYSDLDNMTSGFREGELIIVAARPAMGKTTFGMNLIQNIAMDNQQNKPALVFSLEMPAKQLVQRLIAAMSRVDQTKIRNMDISIEDWSKITSIMSLFAKDRKDMIYIDDSSGLSPMEMRARARRLAREHGGLSAIMVDYLQLMKIPGYDANSRQQEVSECSRSLKALAKEMNVPVIALAQLNRGLESRKDKRPMNSDLRESGSIEQDADVILFVHREEVYNTQDADLKGKAEIIIGKQRNGPIGSIDMRFLNQFSRFEGVQQGVQEG